MFVLEEYFNKLLNITICCNRKNDINDKNNEKDEDELTPYKRIKKRKLRNICQLHDKDYFILPKCADSRPFGSLSTFSVIDENYVEHANHKTCVNDMDIYDDIDDEILKIKKELEDSMSFKYHSDLHKSPRTPI
jgi:hypothetical protein